MDGTIYAPLSSVLLSIITEAIHILLIYCYLCQNIQIMKCIECGGEVLLDNNYYCQPCNSVHWRDNFQNWTSGDSTIDKLIRESQINATDAREVLKM